MKLKYSKNLGYKNINLSKNTIINSIASILLAVTIIIFEFVRTSLTSYVFGVASLGFLTIVLGILPYLTTSHSGLNSVSTFNLIEPLKKQTNKQLTNYDEINQKIANLKPQYYVFGSVYTIITIIIAFVFPFIFNNQGTLSSNENNFEWYESTLFILSNCVELWATYFIVPISIILLFIHNKSYIYSWLNILFTFLVNIVIIVFFICIKFNLLNISFIWMNVLIFCLLGLKIVVLMFSLIYFRKNYFPWYKRIRPNSWKVSKNNIKMVLSQYLRQFGSDLFSIAFTIYAAISIRENNVSFFHGNHGGGSISSDFEASAIFSVYLLLISSATEIVHSIIDAAIPSVAEHMINNNKRINKHFFHRYQLLTTYITCYAITTFLFTICFSNSLFLETDHGSIDHHHIDFNWILSIGLCIPIFIESITSSYDHLLPIFGNFNEILKINFVRAIINTLVLVIFATSICFSQPGFETDGLYISMIISWSISALVTFLWSRSIINKYIITSDDCINLGLRTFLTYLYIFIPYVCLIPIFIIYSHQINESLEILEPYVRVIIIVVISLINFVLCFFNLYIFRKQDVNYYIDSLRIRRKEIKFI